MDMKQILTAIAVLGVTFALLAGAFVGIYFFYPEMLGFSPKKSKAKHLLSDSTMTFADSVEAFQRQKTDDIVMPYDSLKMMALSLKDSLKDKNEIVQIYNDSISALVKRIVDLNQNENKMLDSISSIKSKLSRTLADLKDVKGEIVAKDSLESIKGDSLSLQNLTQFAKIYNNTRPSEVAKILEKLDGRDAAKILKLMQAKKAGKVLETMNPEIAAKLVQLYY